MYWGDRRSPQGNIRAQAHSCLVPKHSSAEWMLDGKEVWLTEKKHDLVMADSPPQAEEWGEHSLPKGNPSIILGQVLVFGTQQRATKYSGKKQWPNPTRRICNLLIFHQASFTTWWAKTKSLTSSWPEGCNTSSALPGIKDTVGGGEENKARGAAGWTQPPNPPD